MIKLCLRLCLIVRLCLKFREFFQRVFVIETTQKERTQTHPAMVTGIINSFYNLCFELRIVNMQYLYHLFEILQK